MPRISAVPERIWIGWGKTPGEWIGDGCWLAMGMGYLDLNRLAETDFEAPFAAFGELVGADAFTLL